jgi:hypothetical protein
MPARLSRTGLLLTLLALIAQLAVGGFAPRPADLLALQDVPICHHDDGSGGTPAPAHHPGDCALCPLCLALAGAHSAALPTMAALPGPALRDAPRAGPPRSADAPPVFARVAPLPRGPPARLI